MLEHVLRSRKRRKDRNHPEPEHPAVIESPGMMEHPPTPSLAQTPDTVLRFFPQLNSNDLEIRLVTIQPLQNDGMVHCILEQMSLSNTRPAYDEFVKDKIGKSLRQIWREWAISHETSMDDNAGGFGSDKQPLIKAPSPESYRFNWGDFATLSYVWGSEQDRRNIVLNGKTVSVTANLEVCLRSFAEKGDFSDRYRIWIDAICINQSDEVERASQVLEMRNIYSGSWAVVSWLGENDSEGDLARAFQFLRSLASLGPGEQNLSDLTATKRGFIEESSFFSLHEMLTRPYWSRLWVVQEVIMGASSTILRCGTDELDWLSFCAAIAVLYNGDNWNLKDEMLFAERRRRRMSGYHGWQTTSLHLVHQDLRPLTLYQDDGGKERLGFRRLLEIASSALCRETRDKVFALVGVMEPAIGQAVIQNYGSGNAKLFAAVTRAFISYYDDLEPLRQANPWSTQGAPSWTADWTWNGRVRWSRPESDFGGPLCDSLESNPRPESIYNAAGGTHARYEFSDTEFMSLRCDGFLLDEISGLGAPEKGYFDWAPERIFQHSEWKTGYGDQEATTIALYKALLGARILKGRRVEDRHRAVLSLPSTFEKALPQFQHRGWTWLESQEGYYFKWENWRKANNRLLLGDRVLGGQFTDVIPQDALETDYMEVYSTVCRMVMERRFMLTKNGYLGWAPDNLYDTREVNQTRVGDLIAIIFGCSTPLVIRPCGDKFQIVGEAYVEGFMDGEALELLQCGDRHMTTFSFC